MLASLPGVAQGAVGVREAAECARLLVPVADLPGKPDTDGELGPGALRLSVGQEGLAEAIVRFGLPGQVSVLAVDG